MVCDGGERSIMLIGPRLPNFNPRVAAANDPGSEYQKLSNRLITAKRSFELCDSLPSLEDPDSARRASLHCATPCCEYPIFPSKAGSDLCGRLRSSDEVELQTSAKVIGVETCPNRGCDLKRSFAQRDRGKGDLSRRH